jgi:cytosine/adenosine deaminase-related metal-dependent hydrolase
MQQAIAMGTQRAAKRLFFAHALLPSGWARDVVVAIENGTITAVAANSSSADAEIISGVALPGLPNLHSHAFQRGMAGLTEIRGATQDSFWTWRQLMYRFIDTLTPDDVEAIAAFAYAEMLEGGFTSVAEFHYLHHDETGAPYGDLAEMGTRIAAASGETGIGLTLLPSFYNFSGFGGAPSIHGQRRFVNDPARFLALLEKSRAAIAPLDDAAIGIAPHSLRAITPETLNDVLKAVPDGPIHIHVAEQTKEVDDCIAWSGQRPVAWLLDHMPVDRRWVLIHATHMTDEKPPVSRKQVPSSACARSPKRASATAFSTARASSMPAACSASAAIPISRLRRRANSSSSNTASVSPIASATPWRAMKASPPAVRSMNMRWSAARRPQAAISVHLRSASVRTSSCWIPRIPISVPSPVTAGSMP